MTRRMHFAIPIRTSDTQKVSQISSHWKNVQFHMSAVPAVVSPMGIHQLTVWNLLG